jgi:hypothetical protein
MNAKLEHVRAVYAKLVEDGFDASMKYPGYIAIDDRSYGTANGGWGWNDEEGHGAEFDIDPLEAVEVVVAAIEVNEKSYVAPEERKP